MDWNDPRFEPLPVDLPLRFVTDDPTGQRFQVAYYLCRSDHTVHCAITFGPACAGPPDHAHGGAITAILDEVMGYAAWGRGLSVVTAKIDIAFRQPVPIGIALRAEGRVDLVQERKVFTSSELIAPDGKALATARALFVVLPDAVIVALKRAGKLPPEPDPVA